VRSIRKTILEALSLMVCAAILAFSANQLRGSGHIKAGKNYFDTGREAVQQQKQGMSSAKASALPQDRMSHANSAAARPATPDAATPAQKKLEHPYVEISFDDVKAAFEDPGTKEGLNVFVDARKDDDFEAGHIPGAIQCNPYEVEGYIDRVLSHLGNADRVIVYCGGGDCQDSVFLCRELLEYKVPYNKLYLFEGGWNEWTQRKMPTESGSSE